MLFTDVSRLTSCPVCVAMVASAAVNPLPDAFVETSVASASTTVVGAFAVSAEALPATVAVKAVRSAADAESDSDIR